MTDRVELGNNQKEICGKCKRNPSNCKTGFDYAFRCDCYDTKMDNCYNFVRSDTK